MSLPQENVRALDQLRQRLQQLSKSLNTLKTDLAQQETLPTWDALQTRANLLAADLTKMQQMTDSNREFFTAAHPYPHASFPGHSHEVVLQQLLRKKAEPAVEDWVEDNTNPSRVAKWNDAQQTGLEEEEQQQLWAFAKPASTQILGDMVNSGAFDYEYTLAEKEAGVDNVVTGLRRQLNKVMQSNLEDEEYEEDGDEDEDDDGFEDVKMEDSKKETQEVKEESMEEDVKPAVEPPENPFGAINGIDAKKNALPIEAWLKFMSVMTLQGR